MYTDKDKVELENNSFCTQSVIDVQNVQLPILNLHTNSSVHQITITEDDVKDTMSLINTSKACGKDLIHPRLLREGSSVLSLPFADFLNNLLFLSLGK
jgi:hypothetical protein